MSNCLDGLGAPFSRCRVAACVRTRAYAAAHGEPPQGRATAALGGRGWGREPPVGAPPVLTATERPPWEPVLQR